MKRSWIIGLAIVALIVIIFFVMRSVSSRGAAPRYLTAPVGYSNISATIQETGTVIPVNEVNVGTQVSGTIATLNVDYNSVVKKGQVLATLDPTSFLAASQQAHAALSAAQATAGAASSSSQQQLATYQAALANVNSAQSNVAKANAQLALSHTTVARDHSLLSQGYIAQSQLDTDVATDRANAADVAAAKAALVTAQAQATAARAQVGTSMDQASAAGSQAQASAGQAQQADYNLSHAVITSPIDGIVVSRSVSVGTTVAASFQTPTLFVIASNLKDMEVDASVSEADVGQLRTGAPAKITVPAYPNVAFNGTVQQIRVNPTNVQNVVTYDAIIAVHDESQRLFPGMTANVSINVGTMNRVLTIPTAALLFHPAAPQGSSSSGGGFFAAANGPSTPLPVAGAAGSKVVVYTLQGTRPVAVPIVIGLSDGHNYQVRSGALKAGDKVIVGQLQAHQFQNTNPLGGGVGR